MNKNRPLVWGLKKNRQQCVKNPDAVIGQTWVQTSLSLFSWAIVFSTSKFVSLAVKWE